MVALAKSGTYWQMEHARKGLRLLAYGDDSIQAAIATAEFIHRGPPTITKAALLWAIQYPSALRAIARKFPKESHWANP